MLAVVKTPHIELSINGESIDSLVKWIGKKFEINILADPDEEVINLEDSDFWKEMNKNHDGNMLKGRRLKAELTQKQLAEKTGIKQNIISDYEKGKRKISHEASNKLYSVLK
ncbi:MAG: helix-turn-helix transcriptional regulator [Lentisphaerota bacterium]